MSEKIILELTREEICMLQELAEDARGGYEWMQEVADTLHKKAVQAYKKPVISMEEYKKQVQQVKEKWEGTAFEPLMVRAEESRLRFFYNVEED